MTQNADAALPTPAERLFSLLRAMPPEQLLRELRHRLDLTTGEIQVVSKRLFRS